MKRLVHAHDAIRGGIVAAVGHDPQTHVSPCLASMYSTHEDRDRDHDRKEGSTDEGYLNRSGNKLGRQMMAHTTLIRRASRNGTVVRSAIHAGSHDCDIVTQTPRAGRQGKALKLLHQ